MKKNHKDYIKYNIGSSDRALLILEGYTTSGMDCQPLQLDYLTFGEDGTYFAYMVDEDCIIPDYYQLRKTLYHTLRIYDDESLTRFLSGYCFKIYRAGERGCIIQQLKGPKGEIY